MHFKNEFFFKRPITSKNKSPDFYRSNESLLSAHPRDNYLRFRKYRTIFIWLALTRLLRDGASESHCWWHGANEKRKKKEGERNKNA